MTLKNLLTGSLVLGVLIPAAQAQPSLAGNYTFMKFDYPGAAVSFPLGINSKRHIVGVRVDAKGVNHGYLFKDGKFTDIDYPGAAQTPNGGTFTGGINEDDDIAGVFTDKQGYQHGFLRTMSKDCGEDGDDRCKPVYRRIDVPGAAQTLTINFELGPGLGTAAVGINNHQDIVGLYATHGLYSVGFKLSDGRFSVIDDPKSAHTEGNGSRVFGINDSGVSVGAYATQANPMALQISGGFTFNGKEYTSVYVPDSEKGGFGTQANGINNRGDVVGVFTDPAGTFHGMLRTGGQIYTLDFPGTPYSECHSINAQGDITGAYIIDPSGANYRGFLAFPRIGRVGD